ncbi:peptide chain release factor N(5)-glutamine methyltransferase [Sphingomonas lutea]|uniref:Release factor glutamine methyltransferase n=1 Tax=Sphingomonas lutea TaxID=1045317 RepID=A0A7G9SIR2_9SPHN|nr:peptide chain release factor N(5)-glutamine methyltransferase [Sphingomonas lutea]QNN67737.1 peptide chain release factor N(5)-glutamine methyltransferase [Sphingomonas lutea]
MKAIDRALADAARQLDASSDTARLDAELLMAEALNIDRDRLILAPPDRDVPKRYWDMVERRKTGEPVAYITGRRAFWDIELHVGPGVLIPRPDSEVLISSAIEHFRDRDPPECILDLGTGPGTLLLAALDIWRDASGVGIDVSRRALSYASANARRLGFEKRLKLKLGDWAAGISDTFDLLLCNPPYVAEGEALGPGVREFEPDEALFAGDEGLDAYRVLAPQLPRLLRPGGMVAIEIGPDQADAVSALLARDGLQASVAHDLAGRPRAVLLTWAKSRN